MSQIISRAQWGAQHPDGFGPASLPAKGVYLHHSVTVAPDLVPPFGDDYAAIRTLERIGQSRFQGGVSYTFAVTPAGIVFEGHGIGRRGAHTKGLNSTHRAICLIGNYETATPTSAQLDAVAWLLRHGKTQGWWREARLTGGHRDAPGASTACPGRHAYAAIAQINARAAGAQPQQREDDMSVEFERDVRAMWKGMKPGALAALERDLRGDLAHKQRQLEVMAATLARIEAKLAATEPEA